MFQDRANQGILGKLLLTALFMQMKRSNRAIYWNLKHPVGYDKLFETVSKNLSLKKVPSLNLSLRSFF